MGNHWKKLFYTILNPNNRRKIFTVCSGSLSQSIGRGRISREGALDVRESRERRDNIVPFFSPEKQVKRLLKNAISIWIYLAAEIFHFFEQDRLFCARVDISVTESPTKIADKEKFFMGVSEIFFSKVRVESGPEHPVFSGEWGIFILWPRKKYNFWGGV